MTGKGKLVDLVLGVLIFASIAFIGYKFFAPSNQGAEGGSGPDARLKPVAIGGGTSTIPSTIVRPAHPQWLLEKVKPFDRSSFKSLVSSSGSPMKIVEKTAGCAIGFLPTPTVSLLAKAVVDRMESNELQFLFGFKQPRCYMVGGKLDVLYYSSKDTDPFVSAIGTVTISDLVEYQPKDMPEGLLNKMGITREEYLDFVGYQRPTGLADMLVRLENFSKRTALDGETPHGFPRAEVVTLAQLDSLKKRFPNLVVLDVRAEQEFRSGSLPGAKNISFNLPPGISAEFSWKTLNKDILNSKFDVAGVSDKGPVPVAVVGASSKDPRPLYAMSDLLRFGYRQVYWLREGAKK